MRVLVSRTDRLGDVLLATPALRKLRELQPSAKIHFLVQRSWMPVLAYGSEVQLIPYDPGLEASALVARLKEYQFDVAYILRDEPKVSEAIRDARIPVRIGPYSSLRSFFIFNEGKWQRRSRCLMHEAEYNLDLISPTVPAQTVEGLPRAWIATSEQAKARAHDFLLRKKLSPKKFLVIHPGSSGSARYVSPDRIHYLGQRLVQRGHRVVVSAGPGENPLLEAFKKAAPGVVALGPGEGLELDGLAEVYRQAAVVIAHGTGPLHLAAAVNTPVFGIFPPLFVLSEKRWGPLVAKRSVWMPGVDCPEKYKCRGERCPSFDCMNLFDVENAIQSVEALLS